MKKIIIFLTILTLGLSFKKEVGVKVQGQTPSIGMVTKPDMLDLLDTMNIPKDRNNGALIFTLKYKGTDEQRLYLWQNGMPTSDSVQSYMRKGYLVRPRFVRAIGDTIWCNGVWKTATLFTDATLVRNLETKVRSYGFASYADVLAERVRALAAEGNLSGRLSQDSAAKAQAIANIPAQVNADWNATSGSKAFVLNKPALFDGQYGSLTGRPTLFDGAYSSLTGRPVLFSGTYSDLTGKPVLFSGSYTDLSNKPTIPTNTNQLTNGAGFISGYTETDPTVPANVKAITATNISNWNTAYGWGNHAGLYLPASYVPAWTSITGKPTFFSGAYVDLTNKPVLFDGQYSSLSGLPSLFNGNYNSLTNLPTLFTATQANLLYRPITYTPTSSEIATALGYTPYNGTANPNGYVGAAALSGYQPLLSVGTSLQYRRGDNTVATLNTSVVPELTNLYWTQARFDAAFGAKSTSDLTEGINLYHTQARVRASVSALVNGGLAYDATTGAFSKITPTNSAPTRTLNTNFTVSATRPARLYYSIRIAYSITVLLGSTGVATLQYSMDGGTTWLSFPPVSNSLNLGLALTGYNDFQLNGEVPANALVRITTTATNATITINTALSREVVD